MKSLGIKGGDIVRYLPTPVYLYGMVPGQTFTMSIPEALLAAQPSNLVAPSSTLSSSGKCNVTIILERISSLKNGCREFIFKVNDNKQIAVVKDTCSTFVFEGPMVTAGNPMEIGR